MTKNSVSSNFNFSQWWQDEFTSEEQSYIIKTYKPFGGSGLNDEKGNLTHKNVVNFLIGLQTWFAKSSDSSISEKILTKAESIISPETPILDIHFLFGALIKHNYQKRHMSVVNYEKTKSYCIKQIEISQDAKKAFLLQYPYSPLPRHKGYEQLAILLQKEKKFEYALKLCYEARAAGWTSDWDKRIFRIKTAIERIKTKPK